MSLFRILFLAVALVFASPCDHAVANVLSVAASGKDRETAEINAGVTAVRRCLHATASLDFLLRHMDMVRKNFILDSGNFITKITVTEVGEQGGLVRLIADVDVDEEKIRAVLLGVDPAALAPENAASQNVRPEAAGSPEAEAGPLAAAQPEAAPQKAPEAAPEAAPDESPQKAPEAAPSAAKTAAPAFSKNGPPLPDEEFLALFASLHPRDKRLQAIANGSNVNAAVADDAMAGRLRKSGYEVRPGMTPLMLLLRQRAPRPQDAVDVMNALVEAGADLDVRDGNARTALMHLQINQDPALFEAFLARGPELELTDEKGDTALMLFVSEKAPSRSAKALEVFLAAGANVNFIGQDGESPLTFACRYLDTPDLIPVFVAAGADVNHQNKRQQTPLMELIINPEKRHLPVMFQAVLDGAPLLQSPDGQALIFFLIHRNPKRHSLEILDMLTRAGEDPNAENRYRDTPLFLACRGDLKPEFIKKLLELGADPNLPTGEGKTALMEARQPETAALLIGAGADVNAAAGHLTPLISAVINKRDKVAAKLLDAGADPGHDPGGGSALWQASYHDQPALLEMLLKAGANVNTRRGGGDGATALITSAMYGHVACLERLAASNADLSLSHQGKTALDYLRENKNRIRDQAVFSRIEALLTPK